MMLQCEPYPEETPLDRSFISDAVYSPDLWWRLKEADIQLNFLVLRLFAHSVKCVLRLANLPPVVCSGHPPPPSAERPAGWLCSKPRCADCYWQWCWLDCTSSHQPSKGGGDALNAFLCSLLVLKRSEIFIYFLNVKDIFQQRWRAALDWEKSRSSFAGTGVRYRCLTCILHLPETQCHFEK